LANKIAWDGIDLSPVVFGNGSLADRDFYWIWNKKIDRWALRHQRWKIVKYGRGLPQLEHWQLFDLESDPEEKSNIASQHPEVVSSMHQRFLAQQRKDRDTMNEN